MFGSVLEVGGFYVLGIATDEGEHAFLGLEACGDGDFYIFGRGFVFGIGVDFANFLDEVFGFDFLVVGAELGNHDILDEFFLFAFEFGAFFEGDFGSIAGVDAADLAVVAFGFDEGEGEDGLFAAPEVGDDFDGEVFGVGEEFAIALLDVIGWRGELVGAFGFGGCGFELEALDLVEVVIEYFEVALHVGIAEVHEDDFVHAICAVLGSLLDGEAIVFEVAFADDACGGVLDIFDDVEVGVGDFELDEAELDGTEDGGVAELAFFGVDD